MEILAKFTKLPEYFSQLMPTGLRYLVITLLVMGCFFRFYNLETRTYWFDETYTSIWISGYTPTQIINDLNGQDINIKDIHKYQYPDPNKSFVDTIKNLTTGDPQHPPLYYLLARIWVKWFGNSVATIRSISGVVSLLTFPCMYWLCWELFASPLVGCMAIALVAVSPFHLLYAQEAREYGLWIVTLLLSSAAFLRAMRVKTKSSWGIYAGTFILGLYTFPFTILTTIGHGLYLIVMEGWRWTKTVTNYVLAVILGTLVFSPWLWVILTSTGSVKQKTLWLYEQRSLVRLVSIWAVNIARIFFDINIEVDTPKIYGIPYLIILVIVGYCFYYLFRHGKKQSYLFILFLIAIPALALMLPDLILGGRRSSVMRYLSASCLGIEVTVAYVLANLMISVRSWQRKLSQILMLTVISAGFISCVFFSQVDTAAKFNYHHMPQLAQYINQSSRPLLINDQGLGDIGEILSLSYKLDPKVKLQLVVQPQLPKISEGFTDIFLFNPSESLQSKFKEDKKYQIQPIDGMNGLWKLTKL